VRHRQWLVEAVHPATAPDESTRVALVCLDDDHQGVALEVLWELELGARVLQPETHAIGHASRVDPPRHFAAYLHAVKWSAVSATDAQLFQSPFRAGIKLMAHQLSPLRKALALPRANVFIADDVGLGKTIEAGLIAQELLLRQRVETILIVCPAAVCLQWRDEMQRRFGLHFEVMSRAFIASRRQERGFGVNPWSTHTRFIVSHQVLRRPEYRDPLLAHLGERAGRSLLILDEAHVAAPASSQRYAVDSKITDVIRDIAPRFENRLFLSATPHNGHSNSFSALLELLDPQRFTRGVRVRDRAQLDAVMVRRLKQDLRDLGVESFPRRRLVPITLAHAPGAGWSARFGDELRALAPVDARPAELELSDLLAAYTKRMRPAKGTGALVFINLQKRLLSSVEAFHRTLAAHAASLAEGRARVAHSLPLPGVEGDDPYGADDDARDEDEATAVASATTALAAPSGDAHALLAQMRALAAQHRAAPDAKMRALLDWIQRHQCRAVAFGGADPSASKSDRGWSDTRVILFTEYGDTKRYVLQLLQAAVEGTHRGEARIMVFHGAMSDEARDEVQRAFNAPPEDHPVRILVATDAAREGVNLQGHCADLFHLDIPWNPARMEQRNGRIDRTLQSAPEVRCHYFLYPQRTEDLVLEKVVDKIKVIERDLGSLSAVLMERLADVMEDGITDDTLARLDEAEKAGDRRETAHDELETQRPAHEALRNELNEVEELLQRSRAVMDFDPALLRDAIDVGLGFANASPLAAAKVEGVDAWTLPALPDAWQPTVDTLRTPRGRDEPFWEFRKRPPLPVVFRPPPKMNSGLAQLHLQHPFVQRIMGRFLAQGYSAHDLSRVTVVRTARDTLVRVIVFGRLSVFGRGATRLHDQLLSVAARWIDGREDELRPFQEDADRKAIEMLEHVLAEAPTLDAVGEGTQHRVLAAAPTLFAKLWPHVVAEADAVAVDVERRLARRGEAESAALTEILRTQRGAIIEEISERAQLSFDDLAKFDKREEEQRRKERAWLDDRLVSMQLDLEREPRAIRDIYRVALRRLEPVGLVVLWPETRG
jgi:hypothetical protein